MTLRRLLLSSTVLLAVVVGCGDDDAVAPDDGQPVTELTIVAESISFRPTEFVAPVGELVTVTFDHRDAGISHNIAFSGQGVDERTDIAVGPTTQTVEITFPEPGRYDFVCQVHPVAMTGTVVVR
jgi:plastocyanin